MFFFSPMLASKKAHRVFSVVSYEGADLGFFRGGDSDFPKKILVDLF